MRRACRALNASHLLDLLTQEGIPSVGFAAAFPEAFGGAPLGRGRQVDPDVTQRKIETLISSGQETRKALAKWRLLEDNWLRNAGVPALAVEEAALGLREVVLLEDEDPLELFLRDEPPPSRDTSRQILDNLASRIAESDPAGRLRKALGSSDADVKPSGNANGASLSVCTSQELEHIAKVVRQDLKFRQEPFEWVYDGLKPLLLEEVLTSQKGMHISLAALYTATGRRLGQQLLPQQVPSSEIDAQSFGVSLATAPTPDPWLIRAFSGGRPSDLWLEPTTGKLLDAVDCAKIFPTLKQEGFTSSPVPFWRGLIQVAIVAHQRRGDGDAVAHCLYQLLALDMNAPEWAEALKPANIRRTL